MFQLVSTIMMWTIGVVILSHGNGIPWKKSLYIISFNRLVAAPALLILIFYLISLLTGTAPDKLVSSVIILEASMPCMATVVIMAKEFGSDDSLAVGNVFVSTIFSILTLPLVVMAISKFL